MFAGTRRKLHNQINIFKECTSFGLIEAKKKVEVELEIEKGKGRFYSQTRFLCQYPASMYKHGAVRRPEISPLKSYGQNKLKTSYGRLSDKVQKIFVETPHNPNN